MFQDARRLEGHDVHVVAWQGGRNAAGQILEEARIGAAIGQPVLRTSLAPEAIDELRRNGFVTNAKGEFHLRAYAPFNVFGRVRHGDVWNEMGRIDALTARARYETRFSLIAPWSYGRPGPMSYWLEDLALRDMVACVRLPGARRCFAAARSGPLSTAVMERDFERMRGDRDFETRLKAISLDLDMSDDGVTKVKREALALRRMAASGDGAIVIPALEAAEEEAARRAPIPSARLSDFFHDRERLILLALAQWGPLATNDLRDAIAEHAKAQIAFKDGFILRSLLRSELIFQVRDAAPSRKFRWGLMPRGRMASLFL